LRLDNNFELVGGSYEYVTGPFFYNGTDLGGTYRVRYSDIRMLRFRPRLHWHGRLTGFIYLNATESLAPFPVKMSTGSFSFDIQAVADLPLLTVPPQTVFVRENGFAVFPNLSATLVDNITDNGAEYLSVVFSNVPEDSIFSKGAPSLNGKIQAQTSGMGSAGFVETGILTCHCPPLVSLGTWIVFNPADLKDIVFTPPPYWSGNLTLTLSGVVMELSNGNQVSESVDFNVYIEPVASDFEILTNDIDLPGTGSADILLNLVLLDQRGVDPGETPEEIITLNFTNVPNSTFLLARKGGRLVNSAPGTWLFTGTQDQAEGGLKIVNVNQTAGNYFVSTLGVTQDAGDMLDTPTTDDFPFKVVVKPLTVAGRSLVAANQAGVTVNGTSGNDILRATAFAGQILNGNAGMDLFYSSAFRTIMTGGPGSDQFVFLGPSTIYTGLANDITDFSAVNGDVLNVGALVDPKFNLQLDNISKVVKFENEGINNTMVQVFDGTTWRNVVRIINGVGGATAEVLWSNGNLLV
jgi:hypothetical protein